MSEQISIRIGRALGVENLSDLLVEKLSGADLHSLLLAVLKRRIALIEPAKLAVPHAVTAASNVSSRLLNAVEKIAYDAAATFEAIELSPVIPLGAIGRLTGLDQGNVLSTIRAFECAADPTVGLALESARRRKNPGDRNASSKLCTSQRVMRFPTPTTPGFTAHFKLFCLVTAGRDSGSFLFETEVFREQISFYLHFVTNLSTLDFAFSDINVEISDTRVVAHLCTMFGIDRDEIKSSVRARDSASSQALLDKHGFDWPDAVARPAKDLAPFNLPKHLLVHLALMEERVLDSLQAEHNGVTFKFNPRRLTGLGYYDGPCFHIKMQNSAGESFMLADGGFVKWTQQLLGDKKERLMTSAIGTELMCRLFRSQKSEEI